MTAGSNLFILRELTFLSDMSTQAMFFHLPSLSLPAFPKLGRAQTCEKFYLTLNPRKHDVRI